MLNRKKKFLLYFLQEQSVESGFRQAEEWGRGCWLLFHNFIIATRSMSNGIIVKATKKKIKYFSIGVYFVKLKCVM